MHFDDASIKQVLRCLLDLISKLYGFIKHLDASRIYLEKDPDGNFTRAKVKCGDPVLFDTFTVDNATKLHLLTSSDFTYMTPELANLINT